MFSHVEQALEHLSTALDGIEAAPSDQLRRTLRLSKQLRSRVELLETKAAALVARREDHGDGGAGLLGPLQSSARQISAWPTRSTHSSPPAQPALAPWPHRSPHPHPQHQPDQPTFSRTQVSRRSQTC